MVGIRGSRCNLVLEVNNDALLRAVIGAGVRTGFVQRGFADEGMAHSEHVIARITFNIPDPSCRYQPNVATDLSIQSVERGLVAR